MAAGLLVILTLLATVHPAGSQLDSPAAEILPSVLGHEILHIQTHFKLHLCVEIFVLKLVPSINDVVSDFMVADAYSSSNDTLVQTWVTNYAYLAICGPAIYEAWCAGWTYSPVIGSTPVLNFFHIRKGPSFYRLCHLS